ncbi:MAG: hypothetical protein MZV70_41905 [Desulfobacterales bacterium]|nr:hypothetical protein [Desulfobacterales bacterium]
MLQRHQRQAAALSAEMEELDAEDRQHPGGPGGSDPADRQPAGVSVATARSPLQDQPSGRA